MAFDSEMIQQVYDNLGSRVEKARKLLGRPLTQAEKILYAHLFQDIPQSAYTRGESYVDFAPDRVAMQDATAQRATVFLLFKVLKTLLSTSSPLGSIMSNRYIC